MLESPDTLFDQLAEDYEAMREELAWDPFPHIREAFAGTDFKGLQILDAGCGTGECTRWFQAQGAQAVGLDISPEMCFQAACKSENVFYLTHDLSEPLPFEDGRFDGVVALGCLEYLENIEAVIAEFARVLKPGGIFLGCFERCGSDCPNGEDKSVVFFDHWMRYRQTEPEIEGYCAQYFKSYALKRVDGFILQETDERTQYIRVIAKKG